MLKISTFSVLLLSVFSAAFASSDALIYEEQTIVLNGESRLASWAAMFSVRRPM